MADGWQRKNEGWLRRKGYLGGKTGMERKDKLGLRRKMEGKRKWVTTARQNRVLT